MARILVADDDEGVRSYLADALEMYGHDITAVGDGREAAKILADRSFHVLLTDLKMPHLDGMALLKHTRVMHPEVEVIVLTAHGSVDSAVEAMKQGALDFIQKPISSPGALRQVVQRAVERHRLRRLEESTRDDSEPPLSWGAPAMTPVVEALRKAAPTAATMLLLGPSGSGKEVAARAIHRWSKRAEGPFVAVNCAALSESLLESELFGHERGAFTGADRKRRGKIEYAEGGTFFLDEVGELRPELQAKLLRVLQERRFERVGGNQIVEADVRWVAATNRDLEAKVRDGSFREDLYYRLAVFPVHLPPLCERREDLVPLTEALLLRIGKELGKPGLIATEAAQEVIAKRPWPGNIRQLANALERAAILSDSGVIDTTWLRPSPSATGSKALPTMEDAERDAITGALAHFDGNRRQAADHLGIGLRTLYEKLKRFEIG